jgi:hypothetical protein
MSVIWKAKLIEAGTHSLTIPQGAWFLHVSEQDGFLCVWFGCDPTAPEEKRTFSVLATGYDQIPIRTRYIGTAVMQSGLVWHVFEHLI